MGNMNVGQRGEAPTRPHGRGDTYRRWRNFVISLLIVWVFVFQIAPRAQRLGVIRVLHEFVRVNDIEATALYYTEIEEFSDADAYMRDAMAH